MRRHLALLLAIAATGCTIQISPVGPVGPRVMGSAQPGGEPTAVPSATVAVTPRPEPPRSPSPTTSARPSATPMPGRTAMPSAMPGVNPSAVPSTRPSGQPATSGQGFQMPASARMPLNYASYLATDSQGALYIVEEYGKRVWRRTPDGEMKQVLGEAPNAPPEWKLEGPVAAAVDRNDRLLVLDATRALRVWPNGNVEVIKAGLGGRAGYIAAGDGDDVWIVDTYTWDSHYTLHHVDGTNNNLGHTVRVELTKGLHLWGFGRDRKGRLIGHLHVGGIERVQAPSNQGAVLLDPVTGQPSPLKEIPDVGGGECTVDGSGKVYYTVNGGWLVNIDGQAHPLAGGVNPGLMAYDEQTGTLFNSEYYQVFASGKDGKRVAIAGTGERPAGQ